MNHNLNQTREELQVKSQMMMPIPPNIVASQENCINKVRDQYINEINSLKKQYNKMIREMKENESMLNVNNDSVKILKSFNQDEKIYPGFYDAGLEVVNSTAIFNTKEFYVGSSDKKEYESFDYGLRMIVK